MCKLLAENTVEKAVVIELAGNVFCVTKRCIPETEFQGLFPGHRFEKYEHVPREKVLRNQDVLKLVKKKKIGCVNCNVRILS